MSEIQIVMTDEYTWHIPIGAEEVKPIESPPLQDPPTCWSCERTDLTYDAVYMSRTHDGEEIELCEDCEVEEMDECTICGIFQVDDWARREDRAIKVAVPGEEPTAVCEECRLKAPR